MAPTLKISVSSGSKKETQIYFFFSLKKSRQTNPLQVLQQDPYGDRHPFTGNFCISLETLIKIPLNKNFVSLLSKALRKERPSVSPKVGLYGNRRPFPEPYLTYPSGSPAKEPSLQVPFMESVGKRCPFLEPSFIHFSKSPAYEPPSKFQVPLSRKGTPMERDARIRNLSKHIFQAPQQRSPPLRGPLH